MAGLMKVLEDADEITARLIAQLLLEDAQDTRDYGLSVLPPAEANDCRLARSIFASDVKNILASRRFKQPPQQPSSLHGASHRKENEKAPPVLFECISCTARFDADHCFQVPCKHYYCDGCLNQVFALSMTDERMYPPRCCTQAISFEDVKVFLDAQVRADFAGKKEELDDTNRTYCHVSTCSTYIGQNDKDGNVATCPKCDTKTCILCKQASHGGDCTEDGAAKETRDLARAMGWQTCPQCKRTVELNMGCNHITCLCRAEFCYVCGTPWKKCKCPTYSDQSLRALGVEIAQLQGRRNVDAVVEHLRENHDCVDHDWEWIHGRHQCGTCRETLSTFIFRCETCWTQVCRRCRYNRM